MMGKKNKDIDLDLPILTTNSNSGKGAFIFIIVLLAICCLGLSGYVVYLKFFVKNNTTVIKKTSEALEQVQIDDISLLEVEDVVKTLEYSFNDPFSNYYGYIYSTTVIKASTFDKGAALFACIYPHLDNSNNVSYVANNTVKANFKSIFGNTVKYEPNDVDAGNGYAIKYDPKLKYYSYQRLGVGGAFHPTMVTFNETCTVSEEKIEITKRVAFLEYSQDHNTINIYADRDKKKSVGVLSVSDGSFNPTEIKEKYNSSLAQYKYTFVTEKDNFVFEKVERIKN